MVTLGRVATRTPPAYKLLDHLTGGILLFQIVWAPWAFGSTTAWAVWTLNIAGYTLGVCWLAKALVRRHAEMPKDTSFPRGGSWATRLLGALTLFFLAYVLTSALNGRARVETVPGGPMMTYSETYIPWLPHSFDVNQTWKGFWRYLGLAATFWGGRDWLLGRSKRDRRSRRSSDEGAVLDGRSTSKLEFPPFRFRMVLWTLILSSSVMAVVGISQRLDGSEKLLWAITPAVKQVEGAKFAFGPFAYRGNGAQYFNLVWPVGLGFWWVLREKYRRQAGLNVRAGGDPSLLLIPLTCIMAAVPILAGSRGGFYILLGQLVAVLLIFFFQIRRISMKVRFGITFALSAGILLGVVTGGDTLRMRFEKKSAMDLSGREVIWNTARRMADDFPLFGSGAETFPTLNYLYRDDLKERWHGYVHDDYLELRLSMGWIGFVAVLTMLGLGLGLGLLGSGVESPGPFRAFLGVGIVGILIHARADFPMQVVGILFTFLILVLLFGSCGSEQNSSEAASPSAS